MPALRILLVDDHEDSLLPLSTLLRSKGHTVTAAKSVADALATAARLPEIDLLISDLTLPDGDGCLLLRILRERVGGGPRFAIALSGHDEQRWLGECSRSGFGAFFTKPVAFDKLLQMVATRTATV